MHGERQTSVDQIHHAEKMRPLYVLFRFSTIISDAVNVNLGHLYVWATCHAHSVVKALQYLVTLNRHGGAAHRGEGVRFTELRIQTSLLPTSGF